MIAWLLKKVASSTPVKPVEVKRVAPEHCALWHDVSRALDAKPRDSR